jgi:hypothetical protein
LAWGYKVSFYKFGAYLIELYWEPEFHEEIFNTYETYLTLKVNMKCRRELAPVEVLLESLKEQSYEDNKEESAPGAHAAQEASPDLQLKVQTVLRDFSGEMPASVYKYSDCSIQQMAPVVVLDKNAVVMPLC